MPVCPWACGAQPRIRGRPTVHGLRFHRIESISCMLVQPSSSCAALPQQNSESFVRCLLGPVVRHLGGFPQRLGRLLRGFLEPLRPSREALGRLLAPDPDVCFSTWNFDTIWRPSWKAKIIILRLEIVSNCCPRGDFIK